MLARCFRAPSHQVRIREIACLGKPEAVLVADHYCIDASARQNAEQQLSQAAEHNFVSRSPYSTGCHNCLHPELRAEYHASLHISLHLPKNLRMKRPRRVFVKQPALP